MRFGRTFTVLGAVTLVMAVPVAAQAQATAPGLRAELDAVTKAGAVAAVAEYRDGAYVWRGASGVAELGRWRPAPENGRFRAGSITKSLTSTVVVQLAGEGRLSLSDPVSQHLPGLVPNGDQITLRQLLNHTSGVYNYTRDLFTSEEQLVRDRYRSWEPEELVAVATRHTADFPPGTSWSYSNTGYVLLGMVIEKVTGRSYAGEVERRVLRPAGMHRTSFPGDFPLLTGPHAHGYVQVKGKPVDITSWNPSAAWAAGEIVTTTDDLNRFYRSLLTGKLVRPALLAEMLTPDVHSGGEYGLGLQRVALPCGGEMWGHTGGVPGYSTFSFSSVDGTKQLTLSTTAYDKEFEEAVVGMYLKAFCGEGASDGLKKGSFELKIAA